MSDSVPSLRLIREEIVSFLNYYNLDSYIE